jgi:hypothetical protein
MKENIFDTFSKLVEVNLQLFKLEIKEEVSSWAVQTGVIVLLILLINIVVVFGSFAMAFLLGAWLESNFLGFAIITVGYLLLLLLIWASRKQIENSIYQHVQQNLFEKQKELAQKQELLK